VDKRIIMEMPETDSPKTPLLLNGKTELMEQIITPTGLRFPILFPD